MSRGKIKKLGIRSPQRNLGVLSAIPARAGMKRVYELTVQKYEG